VPSGYMVMEDLRGLPARLRSRRVETPDSDAVVAEG
jgi:hypothetical protein